MRSSRSASDRFDDLHPLTLAEQRLSEHPARDHLAVERDGNAASIRLDARSHGGIGDACAVLHLDRKAVELDLHA
jgi:hypothetical protein